MNTRKPTDCSAMYATLDKLAAKNLPQMELYCEIGRSVSGRPEKGAAVAVAEYLCAVQSDASGFSPQNLRRMREFYHAYESAAAMLAQAMAIGWTQNVVILEADLTIQERTWYILAAWRFGWSKLKLTKQSNPMHIWIQLSTWSRNCAILRKIPTVWKLLMKKAELEWQFQAERN